MKYIAALIISSLLLSTSAFAQKSESPVKNENDWDFFCLAFFPNVPSSAKHSEVYGVKFGAPISFGMGNVTGVEASVFGSMSYNVDGIQTGVLFCVGKEINGVQASPVCVAKSVNGLQFGLVNISSKEAFQLGVFNYIKDGWCPILPIINFNF